MSQPGEKDFIKRVIGLPGDRVSCCDDQGRVLVNGHPLDEADYVLEDSPLDAPDGAGTCRSRQFDEVVVEPEQIFVMGDHRLVSQDSRCQGQVPIGNIIGRAFVVVWPNDRWHSLAAPETFRDVPPAAAADPDAGQTPGAAGASGGSPVPELPAVLLPVLVLSLVRRSDWACSRGSALVACASHRRLSE
jgi:signal peptidase I